jgi:hypothetical protein
MTAGQSQGVSFEQIALPAVCLSDTVKICSLEIQAILSGPHIALIFILVGLDRFSPQVPRFRFVAAKKAGALVFTYTGTSIPRLFLY